jgi:carbamoyltransferase
MLILGISCFYHDSAIAIVRDGEILFALQEERVTRIKGDNRFPEAALTLALKQLKISLEDFDQIAFYENPVEKAKRVQSTTAPELFPDVTRILSVGTSIASCLSLINGRVREWPIRFGSHHKSHSAAAYFTSPFIGKDALILCLDAVGEHASSTLWSANKVTLELNLLEQELFPNSLGIYYSAFTAYLGFKVNSGEYKVMGLAPYGDPVYAEIIEKEILKVGKDESIFSFMLNETYISPSKTGKPFNDKLLKLLGGARKAESQLTKFHFDIAASVQRVLESKIIKIVESAIKKYSVNSVCLAGGVALNCTANGKLQRALPQISLYVQPASGDAGGALGAALELFQADIWKKKKNLEIFNPYTGPDYKDEEVESVFGDEKFSQQIKVKKFSNLDEVTKDCANILSAGNVCGWFQGKAEFGPRALGARSILASPLYNDMQNILNTKIKFRESFRPFAPSMLEDDFEEYFDGSIDYYMLSTKILKKNKHHKKFLTPEYQLLPPYSKLNFDRSSINPVVHVDGSARVQVVTKNLNKIFLDLLVEFKKKSGVGILVNTSFNVRGEPIVNSPEDALNTFLATSIDVLYIGKYKIEKSSYWKGLDKEFLTSFPLD